MRASAERLAAALSWLVACARGPTASPAHPHPRASEVQHAIAEAELPTVRLPRETIARLRLETGTVREGPAPRTRLVGGEVVAPGRAVTLTAPVAGQVRSAGTRQLAPGALVRRGDALFELTALAPADRDTRARALREVAAARASLAALELRVARNRALVERNAGSARALEEAVAAQDVARADLGAARARAATLARGPLLSDVAMLVRAPTDGVLRAVSFAEGQPVAAGAPLFELVALDALQVRVPVYAGDLARVDEAAPARVRRASDDRGAAARFVAGPPTAEPERATVDRYLALPADAGLALGERVLVELPLRERERALVVAASSLVLDAWGGAWVYQCDGERFARARVDPARRVGDDIVLSRGPAVGSCVVTVGAVELFGAEFPPGH